MAAAGDELRSTSKAIKATTKKTLRSGGNDMRKRLLAAAGSPTGGDLVFSGAGGKPLGVTVTVAQGNRTTTLTVKPQARTVGRWTWANEGTRAGGRRARRGRTRYTMRHPGTSGNGAWDRTVDREVPKLIKQLQAEIAGSVN